MKKEEAIQKAVRLLKICEATPTKFHWDEFVAAMSDHHLTSKEVERSDEYLKGLEHKVHLGRASDIIQVLRLGHITAEFLEELQDYIWRSIISPEEIGLRPGELNGYLHNNQQASTDARSHSPL